MAEQTSMLKVVEETHMTFIVTSVPLDVPGMQWHVFMRDGAMYTVLVPRREPKLQAIEQGNAIDLALKAAAQNGTDPYAVRAQRVWEN